MKDYTAANIRNIGVFGHGGEGKTTLTEAMLFNAGLLERLGKVENGTTTTDFDPEEIKRTISINAALAPLEWKDTKINVIDAPGFFDFYGEVSAAMALADSALIVVGAVSGPVVGVEKAMNMCKKAGKPRMMVVNQMDRENANFTKTMAEINEKFGPSVVPVQLPIMEGGQFVGYVDVPNMTAKKFDGKGEKEIAIPANMEAQAQSVYEALTEAAAETDEALMEKFFSGEELTIDEIKTAIRKSTIANTMVPVVCGTSYKNKGVQRLLDAIVDYMPSPLDVAHIKGINPKTDEEEERPTSDDAPFSALAFKIMTDPFVGRLCFLRVYSGKITAGSTAYNPGKDVKERFGRIVLMHANHREDLDEIMAGDIAGIVGIKNTTTGDTLCDEKAPIILESMEFPEPVIRVAIEPKTKAGQDKMGLALAKLAEEDPTFKTYTDEETGQTIIAGMGELHLEIIVDRLLREFKVEANVGKPQVSYRETIRRAADQDTKYARQSGGKGQYGHVKITIEPNEQGKGYEFINKVVGGNIPKEYIPAVDEGIRGAMQSGVLAGYNVVDVKVTLNDGSYHEVDSSEMAFKIAGSMAFKEAMRKADPVLTEPIMKVVVTTPEEYMGDVIGDLNSRRGAIQGMENVGGAQQITAMVPLSMMFGYATDMRSKTQGRGQYTMEPDHYAEVPKSIAETIASARAKKD